MNLHKRMPTGDWFIMITKSIGFVLNLQNGIDLPHLTQNWKKCRNARKFAWFWFSSGKFTVLKKQSVVIRAIKP